LYFSQSYSEVVKQLKLPVILVVGVRLGCINHALLTAEAILRDGVKLAGFIANQVDNNVAEYDAIIDSLCRMLPAPCLGVVPFIDEPDAAKVANFLDLSPLELG
jgi:dethiobiotin synthetase